jgi:hypothetical protein
MRETRYRQEMAIRIAAMKLATDADICAMTGLTPEGLAPHRELIDRTRAAAMASMKFRRMRAQASKVKRESSNA